MAIKIIIVDDHEIFRDGLRIALRKDPTIEIAGEAENGAKAIELATLVRPDVVIMDIQMPVMDGIEATRKLRKLFPNLPVIALSMFQDEQHIIDMLDAGASGYLLKNVSRGELITAIQTVSSGGNYYDSHISRILTKMIASTKNNPFHNLVVSGTMFSEKELEIIRLICTQYSNREIAETLGLSVRTIEGYRERIQEKTGARNAVGIAIYAIKNRLVDIGASEK